jgi:hypothetical protein
MTSVKPEQPGEIDEIVSSGEVKSFTVELPAEMYTQLEVLSRQLDRTMDSMIAEAVRYSMTPPGGAARIARKRRQFTPSGGHEEMVWAAIAYLMSYAGIEDDARRVWPWRGKFTPGEDVADNLATAGALVAAEIDRWQEGTDAARSDSDPQAEYPHRSGAASSADGSRDGDHGAGQLRLDGTDAEPNPATATLSGRGGAERVGDRSDPGDKEERNET